MNLQTLDQLLINEPEYRKKQTYQAIFDRLITDWQQASNLSRELRDQLSVQFPLNIKADLFRSKIDQTIKALIHFPDGQAVETVLMRSLKGRNTVCVSSQIGCPLACTFCATGKMGLIRNLTDWEICEQVLFFARLLKEEGDSISNIVFMGMGEPFLNYDNVLKAIKVLNNKEGLHLGARRFSISTCGITEGIERLATETLEINLAISLHASNDQLRSHLMPINNRYSIAKILKSVNNYLEKTKRKVMFEYLLLRGINDSVENAQELAKLIKHHLYMVNLIKYNPTNCHAEFISASHGILKQVQNDTKNATSTYKASEQQTIAKFRQILEQQGVETTQRFSFGQDIHAACGQLAIQNI